MTRAIILAGGLGSRLYKYTNGVYPKILLSLGNETMLDKIIKFWFEIQQVDELLLVFSEKDHFSLVDQYIKEFFPQYQTKIKLNLYPKTDGTFNTLFFVLNQNINYLKDDIILCWSDILPKNKIASFPDKDWLPANTIKVYTDPTNIHRYNAINNKIELTQNQNGNVVGIYALSKLTLKSLTDFYVNNTENHKEVDFVEFLKHQTDETNEKTILTEDIEVFDIGDVQKYETYLKTVDTKQRWFNDIKFEDGLVTKQANSDYGKKVIESEIAFYQHVKNNPNMAESFPTILALDNNKIVMADLTKHGYDTVNHFVNRQLDPSIFIEPYNNAISKLHSDAKPVKFNNDIYKEYIQVPIERYSKIAYFIPKQIKFMGINEYHELPTFYEIIGRLTDYLSKRTYEFGTIHGDTNSTNTMYNPLSNKIKFIDPRGKFGDSMIYGDIDYDKAKFLYGLTGYDQFNLDQNFKFEISGNCIDFNINGIERLDEFTEFNHLKVLVGLIWLKLPFYIRNNPNKIIASYFNGIRLLDKYLPK